MKISIIGTGYVGLPTGVGFAELGHQVVCIDKDIKKVAALRAGRSTLFEKDLDKLLSQNIQAGRIHFTDSICEGIKEAEVIIIAVGTPPHPVTKEADMKYIYAAVSEMANCLDHYAVVAVKSTVPVGTGENVEGIIKDVNPTLDCDVVSMPEFLREGFAVSDFFNPDRVVIGTDSERARAILSDLYKGFPEKTKILLVKRRSAEMIKYASNAFLAMKIHYINEMANLCEKVGADIGELAVGMGTDTRIGNKFLNPGPGYGGSCFPKDTLAMAYMGRMNGVELSLIENTIQKNDERKIEMAKRILKVIQEIPNAKIAVLGLAFKGGTDDCRESPAMEIIAELLRNKTTIAAYDPKALKNAKILLENKISYADDAYEAVKDADVVAILTEWDDFKSLDLTRIASLMRTKNIVDCRNLWDKKQAESLGFTYQGIGK